MPQLFPAKEGNTIYLAGRNQATVLWPRLSQCRTPGGQPGQPGQQRQLSLWHVQSYRGTQRLVSRESTVLATRGQAKHDVGIDMVIMIMARRLE